MSNSVPAFAPSKRWSVRFRLQAWLVCATLAGLSVSAVGCGGPAPVPQPKTAAHLQALAVLYGQYRGENKGQTPPDEATFRKFMQGLPPERLMGNTIEEIFVSPRDKKPYIVQYNVKASGMPMPGDTATTLVAWEQEGAGGKRYVATSLGGVEEVDEAKFQSLAPKK